MRIIFKFLDKKVKRNLIIILILSFFIILLETLSVAAIFPLMKILLDTEYLKNISILKNFLNVYSENTILIIFISIIFFIYTLKNLLLLIFTIIQSKFLNFANANFSSNLYKIYLKFEYQEFQKKNTSYYLRNIIDNVNAFFGTFIKYLISFITELFIVLGLFIIMFIASPITSILFVISMGLIGGLVYLYHQKKISFWGSIIHENLVKKLNQAKRGLTLFKEIKLFNKENHFVNSYFQILKDIAKISYKFDGVMALPRLFLEVAGISFICIFILIKVMSNQDPSDFLPILALYALSGFRLMPSANRLIGAIQRLKFSRPMIDFLESEIERFHSKEFKNINNQDFNFIFNQKINIKNLVFKYQESEKKIFDNFNLEIKKGEYVIIRGPSGVGKSTLINLILGLLKPISGEILIDNQNIHKNLGKFYNIIGHAPQDINLIDDTLMANIAFGCFSEEIDKNRIIKSITIAGLKNFVENLPNKLETDVGEKGFKISGGQKQRIGIARAIYTNPKIIILDESTNALDSDTELEIIKSLKNEKMTVIHITHKKELLKHSDKNFTLD
ncbi:ATP-binding cassette domain-containing protein [Candidatus Pelagibacter sp.]|uniref:ATP-binding cassette domain-containing protein n=1 Tax=Candidatus Pelagibacter sp. TaxID=2024849 RepID=UPI003F831088|tara:strand:+ start:1309 stop:2991 length:1683 start_codon:yes stop_codon:yes gene_type:complete